MQRLWPPLRKTRAKTTVGKQAAQVPRPQLRTVYVSYARCVTMWTILLGFYANSQACNQAYATKSFHAHRQRPHQVMMASFGKTILCSSILSLFVKFLSGLGIACIYPLRWLSFHDRAGQERRGHWHGWRPCTFILDLTFFVFVSSLFGPHEMGPAAPSGLVLRDDWGMFGHGSLPLVGGANKTMAVRK